MKKFSFRIALFIMIFVVSGCSSTNSEIALEPTSAANEYLTTDYTDAANIRSQLAFGTIQLVYENNVISAEQAHNLIPLWQGIIALGGDSTTVDEEIAASQDQIVRTLTQEQLDAIAKMQITNTRLNDYYLEVGIVMPTPLPEVTKVPGSGSTKTDEEKAAQQAAAEASGIETGTGSGKTSKTLLYEKVIESLNTLLQ